MINNGMDEKHKNLFFMEHLHFWTFIISFKPMAGDWGAKKRC